MKVLNPVKASSGLAAAGGGSHVIRVGLVPLGKSSPYTVGFVTSHRLCS